MKTQFRLVLGKFVILTSIVLLTFFLNYPSSALSAGWRFTTPMPINPSVAIGRNGFFYVISVGSEWAPIHSDGTLGSWTTSAGFPYNPTGLSLATTANTLYITGGWDGNVGDPASNQVSYTVFNPDGSLGAISNAGPGMLSPRYDHASLIVNGRLYAFGGATYTGGLNSQLSILSTVEFAPINTDGTVSTFQYTSSFQNIAGQVSLAWNFGNSIFCFGCGWIEMSTVQPNGTLSAWTTIEGPYSFTGPAVLTSRTTLFVVQTYTSGSTSNTFQTGITATNGPSPTYQIGSFTPAPPTLISENYSVTGTWDRFVYCLGGQYTTVEFFDPDLADTELFPDTAISPFHSLNIQQIPMDIEDRK